MYIIGFNSFQWLQRFLQLHLLLLLSQNFLQLLSLPVVPTRYNYPHWQLQLHTTFPTACSLLRTAAHSHCCSLLPTVSPPIPNSLQLLTMLLPTPYRISHYLITTPYSISHCSLFPASSPTAPFSLQYLPLSALYSLLPLPAASPTACSLPLSTVPDAIP